MLILELAVQAVRGFSPSARVALKSGYVVMKSPSEIPSPLAGLFTSLCYPDGRASDAAYLAPNAKTGRAGFSFQGNDGNVWRLVRDLGGAGALYGQNRETSQFEVVSQDAAEMSQVLRGTVGLPTRTTFEQLFTFTPGQLPTRTPKGSRSSAKTSGRRRIASALDQFDTGESGDPRTKLAALEEELKSAREVAELQFKMDGVQAEVFKAEERLKAFEEMRAKVEAARAELNSAKTPATLGLPHDIVYRLQTIGDEKRRRDEALTRLEAEREEARVGETFKVSSIFKDQRFLGAILLGLALLIGAAYLEGGWRYLALLSILPFSFTALIALRYIEELQFAQHEASKAELFDTREKKIRDDYELANALVESALEKAGVETSDDFYSLMDKQQHLAPQLAQLEEQFAQLKAQPENADLFGTIARYKAEHESLNAELMRASGGYAREVREIERDIERLKEQLEPSQPQGEFEAVSTGAEKRDDPTPGLMLLGADLFGTDIPTLWGVLRDRTVQYLTALTDRRYHGMDVDKDGRAVVEAPGRSIPAGELPGKDLDLVYLSLRLTLIEKYSSQAKVPVLIEGALGAIIDAPKQSLFQRMLKHLGSLTQVLHVTGVGQNVEAADSVVTV